MKILKQDGLTFLIVMVFILAITISAAGFVKLMSSEVTVARYLNNSTRAFYIAEAGIEQARAQLDADWDDRSSLEEIALGDGTYTVEIYTTDSDGDALPSYELRV